MIQGFVLPAPGVFTSLNGLAYTNYTTLNINSTSYLITGALNPTVTAVDAPESSLYLRYTGSGGIAYIKNDSGSSTNWSPVVTGGGSSFTNIQAPAGGTIVAEIAGDTWTIESSDSSMSITNTGATDTTDFIAVGGGKIYETDSYSTPLSLANSANISAPSGYRTTQYVQGSGGAVTGITLSAGSGHKELFLIGCHSTNTVQLISSTNVQLSGTMVLKAGSVLSLRWVAGLAKWLEVTRNEI